ncbi:MAG: amino acid transport protein [Fibrobacteria bacterium]
MNPSKLFIEFLFGLFGTGYFIFGKKRGSYIFMGAGAGLCVFPYFVDPLWAILLVGALLTAVPFVIRGE